MHKTEILRKDILSIEAYERIRAETQKKLIPLKALRRISVGPYATFYFENYETMWYQIQEMLRIEKGGETQIVDEISAYCPLVPKGRELVATLMFEIEDKQKRSVLLGKLGGIENLVYIQIDNLRIYAKPAADQERSEENGRTASVHFLHFHFTVAQIETFMEKPTHIILGFDHKEYGHMAILTEDIKKNLAKDFLVSSV